MKTIITRQNELVKISPSVKRAIFQHIHGRGNRSTIKEFSKGSRKRLLEKFAILDPVKAKSALFVTLTYIDNFQDFTLAHKHIELFLKRIAYRFPEMFACWRMELQARGAIHFHIMLWNIKYIPKQEVGQMWGQITKQWRETEMKDGTVKTLPPFTRIEKCQNRRKCWHYISKYISKDNSNNVIPDSDPDELFDREYPLSDLNHSTMHPDARTRGNDFLGGFNYVAYFEKKSSGRWWGWFNRKNIPLADIAQMEIEVTIPELIRFHMDLGEIMPHTRCIHISHTVKMFWFHEDIDVFIMLLQGIDGKPALGWKRRIET